ncbi:hypothetical protein [Agrococcus sediminis]|uniref:hypothetical protein n=1 Tax=Agrococcus sediminis TaxID=2599924 RepID=UPI001788D7DB|nr:hypothetical protein [Agrococcus sediminis]
MLILAVFGLSLVFCFSRLSNAFMETDPLLSIVLMLAAFPVTACSQFAFDFHILHPWATRSDAASQKGK